MKKILYLLSTVALFAVSCSTDDVSDVITQRTAPRAIGFMTNTTRANVITLAELQGDGAGFVVYATNGSSPSAWNDEIKGGVNYIYNSTTSTWAWNVANLPEDQPEWSESDGDYPMNFYAYYAEAYDNIAVNDDVAGVLDIDYTAPVVNLASAPTAKQVDLLTATAKATVRPASDKVPLTFDHALSKIGFGVVVGPGVTTHIQSIGFNGIVNNGVFQVAKGEWGAQSSSMSDYVYLATANPAVENSANGAVTGTSGALMLVPQTTPSWIVKDSDIAKDAYIVAIYRMEQSGNKNAVGYEDAENHPFFDEVANADLKGEPLFVKVGYPVAAKDLVLEMGKAYTYNLNLGTDDATNGYLIDDYYYDEDGNKTDLEVENKKPGDPIRDGYINFIVDVNDWVETDATPIL